ncbi:9243_t:CDS:2, partial [Entrophospora sp. SA101]
MVDYVEPGNRCVLELYWQSHSETEIECNDHNIHSKMFDGITREGVTELPNDSIMDLDVDTNNVESLSSADVRKQLIG